MADKQADNQADNQPIIDLYLHKKNFFSSYSNIEQEWDTINKNLQTISFKTVYHQKLKLEQEFNNLFAVLEKNKNNNDAFWLYCYFCACLLEKYYRGYSNTKKADEYLDKKNKIKLFYIDKDTSSKETQQSFIQSFKKDILSAFKDLLTTPIHASKVRDRAGYLNLLRIYWVFCRFFLERGLLLSKTVNLLDKLDDLLGLHTDVDHILSGFNWPGMALNYSSVGLFAVRSLVNIGAIIKHTWFPSEEEKADNLNLNWKTRLGNEVNKRGVDIINHSGWAAVNFITNFNKICHISGSVAGWIVVGFLLVDVATLLYKRWEEKKAYLLKLEEYEKEIAELKEIAQSSLDQQKKDNCNRRIDILEEQKLALKIDWETKASTLELMVGATFMLMLGFAGSMLLSSALGVMACYLVCVLAVAIYLSDEDYAKYKKSSLELAGVDKCDNQKYLEAKQAYNAARKEYVLTLAKYTLMPTLLIATYAVCWPAAVALTVLMIGYEVFKAYEKHQKENGKDGLNIKNEDQQESDDRLPAASDDRVFLN